MTQESPDAGDYKLALAMYENLKNMDSCEQYYPIPSEPSPDKFDLSQTKNSQPQITPL